MAYPGKSISNKKTKTALRFIQTSVSTQGKYLEMEARYESQSIEPPAHYHPYQNETFTILKGEMTVRIDNKLKILKKGDSIHIEKNKKHSMWNNGLETAHFNWKVEPALNTEFFFETIYGLVNENKTNEQGKPGLLQISMLMKKYGDVIRLSNPPFYIQKLIFSILSPVAKMQGYKSEIIKYHN